MEECWVTWWGVRLHARILTLWSVGLHGGSAEVYGGCWVTWWVVGLHARRLTLWSVGLYGGC